jgi:hypothetical protein
MTTKEVVDASTPLLDDVDVIHVVQVSPCNVHFKGTAFFFYKVVAHKKIHFFGVTGLIFGGYL